MIKKFARNEVYLVLVLFFVAVIPLILHKGELLSVDDCDSRLVIMTPHDETIQREFGEAFSEYWKEKTGETLYVEWRKPNGTSERDFILGGDFARVNELWNSSVGVDVLFGGGDYLFKKLALIGRLEKLDVFDEYEEWFGGENGLPQYFTGEDYFDEDQQWVGVCLSRFGICYNTDRLARLGIEAPKSWDDLGNPKYFGRIALADPTKSGSVARAFEMLIQQKIHKELASMKRDPGENDAQMTERAKAQGWEKGLQLIQKISANARYFTHRASKIPYDVAQGNAVAGVCVDFHGKAYKEKCKNPDGSSRLQWIAPAGGTSISVDPVGVFRGAKNVEIAQEFVKFLLTERGQLLWSNRPGTPNGAKYHALHRLPIRPNLYTPERLKYFSDPEYIPYQGQPDFVYDTELTGPLFSAMQKAIKVMCIDTHNELKDAWEVMIESSDDEGVMPQQALLNFSEVRLFSYKKTFEFKKLLHTKLAREKPLFVLEKFNQLRANFRRSYADSQQLAKQKK